MSLWSMRRLSMPVVAGVGTKWLRHSLPEIGR